MKWRGVEKGWLFETIGELLSVVLNYSAKLAITLNALELSIKDEK